MEATNLGKKLTEKADFMVRLSLTGSTRQTKDITILWNELWNEEHTSITSKAVADLQLSKMFVMKIFYMTINGSYLC